MVYSLTVKVETYQEHKEHKTSPQNNIYVRRIECPLIQRIPPTCNKNVIIMQQTLVNVCCVHFADIVSDTKQYVMT